MTELTAERLRALFHYDADTGVFTRRVARGGCKSGVNAGYTGSDGYQHLQIDGRKYKTHRLAWLYVYGEWPNGQVDHINGVRIDNWIANLRDVSGSVNQQNQKRATKCSKTGLIGAHRASDAPRSKQFMARIRVNGKSKYLGMFPTAEEAHEAYLAAKRQFHEGNTL